MKNCHLTKKGDLWKHTSENNKKTPKVFDTKKEAINESAEFFISN
ncbi:DUF2188 domain-containing protein [Arcicella rigui]